MVSKQQKEKLLEELSRVPIVEAVCKKFQISRQTFYRWKREDPEFAKRAEEAVREGSLLISEVAVGKLVSAINSGNLGAIIFWLKNRDPAFKNKVELSGQIEHIRKELTDEEKALVEEALRLALPKNSTAENQKT